MRFEDIDLETLENVTAAGRWGAGTDRDRYIFRSKTHFYKLWGPKYLQGTLAAVGDRFIEVAGLTRLHGFEVGLFQPSISSAFVEDIVDNDGILRGYVTLLGTHPISLPKGFVEDVFNACLKCGWVFSDLKTGNLLLIGDQLSIIDFDTHLSCLDKLDVAFETKRGCLRSHVDPLFQSMIRQHLSQRPIGRP